MEIVKTDEWFDGRVWPVSPRGGWAAYRGWRVISFPGLFCLRDWEGKSSGNGNEAGGRGP